MVRLFLVAPTLVLDSSEVLDGSARDKVLVEEVVEMFGLVVPDPGGRGMVLRGLGGIPSQFPLPLSQEKKEQKVGMRPERRMQRAVGNK